MQKIKFLFFIFLGFFFIGCGEKYPKGSGDFSGYTFSDEEYLGFHIKLYEEMKKKENTPPLSHFFYSEDLTLSITYWTYYPEEWIDFIEAFSKEGKLRSKKFAKELLKGRLLFARKLIEIKNADIFLFFLKRKEDYVVYVVIFPYYPRQFFWRHMILFFKFKDYKVVQKVANMISTIKIER